jgi:hypothetical protein
MTPAEKSSMQRPWDRRLFLSALAASMALAIMPSVGPERRDRTARLALDIGGGRPGVRALGHRYLALVPQERDTTLLARTLFGPDYAVPGSLAEARRRIVASRDRDFAAGDTVVVDGWILARTEARLCALCVLA